MLAARYCLPALLSLAVLPLSAACAAVPAGPEPTRQAAPASTAAPAAPGADASGKTVAEITQCSRNNIPKKTAVMELTLTAYGRDGNSRILKAKLFLQRKADGLTQAMLNLRYPPDLRGSSYLVQEKAEGDNATYVYLPDVQRTRKLAMEDHGSTLWTTDFSYEDVTQIQGLTGKGEVTRLPDAVVQERPVYVLNIKNDPAEASSYESVISFVDQKTCVPLRSEFYGYGHKLRKVMTVKATTIKRTEHYWQPRDVDMKNVVEGTHTTLAISDLHYDSDVARKVFNPMTFYRYDD